MKTAQIEILFVGAEESPSCKKIMTDTFSNIERAFAGNNTSAKSILKNEVCRVVEKHDVAQSKMVMAFKTDYENVVAMKLMNAIYGATPISKLFDNVREKLSLCYYCSSGIKKVLFMLTAVSNILTQKRLKLK